jgi:hypothetical protein
MTRSRVQVTLVVLWLASFVVCLAIPFVERQDIPDSFAALLQQVFDTFAPTLAAMIAFIYSTSGKPAGRMRKAALSDILAPFLALIYAGAFITIMIMFASGRLRGDETIQLFQTYRPYLSFLVTGIVAFYFGSSVSEK